MDRPRLSPPASLPRLLVYLLTGLFACLRTSSPARATGSLEAEAALAHTFTQQGLTSRQPLRSDGVGYDWDWTGPAHDPEWSWFFNRHSWFPDLLAAYQETHDVRYSTALLATLDDWIMTHPAPGNISFTAAWRPLEAARRLTDSWLAIAPALTSLPDFTAERAARFRSSLIDHGEHLYAHHAFGGNHLVTEMLALAELALTRPDLPGADRWLTYSLDQLRRAYDEQVYPDGAHTELSTLYQRVIALNYQRLLVLLQEHHRDDLASDWAPRVERLWLYIAAVMTPAGSNPLNNDSDRELFSLLLATHAPALLLPAPTSEGETSAAHSTHFPYAGQTVFRSGPGGAYWAFFEAGPRGTDHDHADHLQFDLVIGENEFLVDNGRYTYAPGPWRDYFAGPTGHNIILLDGHAADAQPPRVTTAPHPPRFRCEAGFELAWGDATFSTTTNARTGDWRRLIVHAPGAGWVVIDRIVSFSARRLTTQWHWAPTVTVAPRANPVMVTARSGTAELTLLPPAGGNWEKYLGAEAPAPVRGWFSPKFNVREPAPQTNYEQPLHGPLVNLWVFRPAAATTPLTAAVQPDGRIVITAGEARLELDPAAP